MAHHAALAPNSPDGSLPAARSLFRTLWTCSPLPHLCLYHRIVSSPGRSRLVTNPETLCQAPPASLTGKGSSSCSSIPGRGCSLSASLIAMNRYFRVLLAVGYPVWYEVHLRPLLTCLDPGGAQSAVRGMPVLFGNLGHRAPELRRHVDAYRKLDHSEALVSALGAVPQQLVLIPSRVRPQHHLVHRTRQMLQRFGQHSQLLIASRYVAVPKLRMHYQLSLGPVGRQRLIRLVLLLAVERLLLVRLHQRGVHSLPRTRYGVQRGLSAGRTALYEAHHIGVHLMQTPQRFVG